MSWEEWKKNQQKHSQHNTHKTEKREPAVPKELIHLKKKFDTSIAVPYIGIVKVHHITLLLLFALFLLTKNMFVGLLAGINILYLVINEFVSHSASDISRWKEGLVSIITGVIVYFVLGMVLEDVYLRILISAAAIYIFIEGFSRYKKIEQRGLLLEIKETVAAISFALILWIAAGFILNTPTPINAIVSCSMLPSYERGDMVILQGADVVTKYLDYKGSVDDITTIATVEHGSKIYKVNGSMYSYCTQNVDIECTRFKMNPTEFSETHGPIRFDYGTCERFYPKTKKSERHICIKKTYYQGEEVEFSDNYDLIVYGPKPGDSNAMIGDIVHRVRFAINATDGVLYFTKGDNNAVYDFQVYAENYKMGNEPVEQEQIKGKVIFRIPYLGNFKLFISPDVLIQTSNLAGCESYFKEQ